MNRFCKPRRNQKSFPAKAQRRKVEWWGLLLAAFTATAALATALATVFTFTLVFAFVFLPLLLFLLLGSGQGAEGDHERGVQGFGTITFQYDGNGIGDIFTALAFVFLPLAIRLAGHKFLLQGIVDRFIRASTYGLPDGLSG